MQGFTTYRAQLTITDILTKHKRFYDALMKSRLAQNAEENSLQQPSFSKVPLRLLPPTEHAVTLVRMTAAYFPPEFLAPSFFLAPVIFPPFFLGTSQAATLLAPIFTDIQLAP